MTRVKWKFRISFFTNQNFVIITGYLFNYSFIDIDDDTYILGPVISWLWVIEAHQKLGIEMPGKYCNSYVVIYLLFF